MCVKGTPQTDSPEQGCRLQLPLRFLPVPTATLRFPASVCMEGSRSGMRQPRALSKTLPSSFLIWQLDSWTAAEGRVPMATGPAQQKGQRGVSFGICLGGNQKDFHLS